LSYYIWPKVIILLRLLTRARLLEELKKENYRLPAESFQYDTAKGESD
jgi:hypothetical protein